MQLPDDAPERLQIVPLRNPKSDDYSHLRPNMLVSLLESLRNNARRNIDDVQIFEIGHIFRNTGGGLRFDYAPRRGGATMIFACRMPICCRLNNAPRALP